MNLFVRGLDRESRSDRIILFDAFFDAGLLHLLWLDWLAHLRLLLKHIFDLGLLNHMSLVHLVKDLCCALGQILKHPLALCLHKVADLPHNILALQLIDEQAYIQITLICNPDWRVWHQCPKFDHRVEK